MLRNEKPLGNPEDYHSALLIALGKKFFNKQNVNLSDNDYYEVGSHFIKTINGEDTHFSNQLKKSLHQAMYPTSLTINSQYTAPNCSFSFLNEFNSCQSDEILKQAQKQIEGEENALEANLLALMKPDATFTFGFHQLRIILQVAQETKSLSGISDDEAKKIDRLVYTQLRGPNGDPQRLIQHAIQQFDQANSLLFALDLQRFKQVNRKT